MLKPLGAATPVSCGATLMTPLTPGGATICLCTRVAVIALWSLPLLRDGLIVAMNVAVALVPGSCSSRRCSGGPTRAGAAG